MSSTVRCAYSSISGDKSRASSARRRSAYTLSRCELSTWSYSHSCRRISARRAAAHSAVLAVLGCRCRLICRSVYGYAVLHRATAAPPTRARHTTGDRPTEPLNGRWIITVQPIMRHNDRQLGSEQLSRRFQCAGARSTHSSSAAATHHEDYMLTCREHIAHILSNTSAPRACSGRLGGARTKEVRLHLALRLIQRIAEHVGLDRHVLDLQHVHHALDAVAAKHAEQAARAGTQASLKPARAPLHARKSYATPGRLPGSP